MNDEQKMNIFLREFFSCVDKLKAMDLEIADDLLLILMLYAIPDSYEIFRVAMESRDQLPKPENREPKHDDAMFARGKCQLKNTQRAIEKSHPKDNEKSFKYKCHRCRKVGHIAKHCRSNLAHQPQQQRRNTQMTRQDCYTNKTSEISLCIGGRFHSKWCLDSGVSSHMCSNKEMFLSMKNMKRTLSLANNKSTEIMESGTANLEILGGDGIRSVKLDNALNVPDLRSNLLLVAKITEKGFEVTFQENSAIIANQNLGTVMVAYKEDGLYYVESPTFIAATAGSKVPTLMEWHRRLGHLNERSLLELTKHEKTRNTYISHCGYLTYGLRFQRESGALMGFSDADWSGNSDDRRSYTGYVLKFGNAAISWESRKQKTDALSSTEAEYMALSEACKKAMHLKRIVEEITGLSKSVILHSDNQSALKLARNPVYHARTKHIDIRYNFIREGAERKDVELRYLPTEQMVADILTKGLFKPKQEKCISEMGLGNLCGESPKRFNNAGEVFGHIVH
ncbi:conserved hypothetical protein [Trichinella spiralis]|uniref:hypothetical protein n=1 Tax=Trichinella spiralis TaxID=6334 RepID=UPI0001EFB8DE|nr:conserved hypothetical protein [Trichinella spiralis]